MADCMVLHPEDNVATVLKKTARGEKLIIADSGMKEIGWIVAEDDIPFAHKISLADVKKGERIIKYGECIGRASSDISRGAYVHIHNVISIEGAVKITADRQASRQEPQEVG